MIHKSQPARNSTNAFMDFWDNRKHFENCVEEGQSGTNKDRPAKGLSVFLDLRSSWLILDSSNMLQKQLQASTVYLRTAKVAQSIIFRKKAPATLTFDLTFSVVFHLFGLNHFCKYKLLAKFVTLFELSKTSSHSFQGKRHQKEGRMLNKVIRIVRIGQKCQVSSPVQLKICIKKNQKLFPNRWKEN